MNEQEKYLKRMSEYLKDIGTTLWRTNDCLERIYRDLRDHAPNESNDCLERIDSRAPKEDEDGTATSDVGIPIG